MEPWDGPAGLVATDGRWVIGGMDRNGLRPMRYARTSDGLVVLGSETGMVPLEEARIVEKGRVGPGGMIGVDLRAGRFYHDEELKDLLAGEKPYGQWVENITHLADLVERRPHAPIQLERAELRRRQNLYGITVEDLELLLVPMVVDAKEAVGSMGDDTPAAVLSSRYRGLHHFFRQQFSQVTNPPIDSLREWRVMSLKTRYGNLGNVYDEAPSQTTILQLESPLLLSTELEALLEHFGPRAATISCTFDAHAGPGALHDAISPHPGRGRGRRARGLRADRAERRERLGEPGADPDDPGGGRGAQPPGAPGPAQLQLDHGALGRVPGRALCRRADRRGRHRGQCLPGRGGDRRPPRPRPAVRAHPGGVPRALQGGGQPGPAEDRLEDGHLDHQQLSRRLQLRGRRPLTVALRRVLPGPAHADLGHRPRRHPEQGAGAAPARVRRRQSAAADRRPVPLPLGRRAACARGPCGPPAAARGRDRFLRRLQEVRRDGVRERAGGGARPGRFRPERCCGLGRRGRIDHRDPQALRHARHVARRARSRGARDAHDRDEPDRREVGQRRGRRGQGPLHAAAQRRQRQLADQAGRLRTVRRHRRVSERLPRARDQDRPGRQARRRAASCPASRSRSRSPSCGTRRRA